MPDYTGPVIDTHHHIWRRTDVPWLAEPPIPRMFGDYFGIRRDYPVEEFLADVMPSWSAYDLRLMLARFHTDGMLGKSHAIDILAGLLGHAPRSYRDFAAELAKTWRSA